LGAALEIDVLGRLGIHSREDDEEGDMA
jgi:hypothetical protein